MYYLTDKCFFFFLLGFGTLDFEIMWKDSLNVLTVTLLRARNLRSCDLNGLSDPYVKLHIVPGVAKVRKILIAFNCNMQRDVFFLFMRIQQFKLSNFSEESENANIV